VGPCSQWSDPAHGWGPTDVSIRGQFVTGDVVDPHREAAPVCEFRIRERIALNALFDVDEAGAWDERGLPVFHHVGIS
jgi:hypothetical protein